MKKEDIHFTDLNRWLFGNTPPEFILEVLLRTLIIYLFLLVVIRLMGKRMTGQITITELCVVITLGAIVSPVMQMPDKGILFGITVLTVAYFFQRGLNLLGFKNEKVEKFTQGTMSVVIKDGIMDLKQMEKLRVSKEMLFSILREKKIRNLGEVERAYWEACGLLSIFKYAEKKAGLPVMPTFDNSIIQLQKEQNSGMKVCADCGQLQDNREEYCGNCHSEALTTAYIPN